MNSDEVDEVTNVAPSSLLGGAIPLIARDRARVMLLLGGGGIGLAVPATSTPTVVEDSSMATVERVFR